METTIIEDHLIFQLFDKQFEAVLWLQPVWSTTAGSEKHMIDLQVKYCNEAATKVLNASKDVILGALLLNNTVLDAATAQMVFAQSLQAYTSNEPVELNYFNQLLDKYLNVVRSRVMDGVLIVINDHTEYTLMEKEKEKQASRYNIILNTSADGIVMLQSVRNEEGEIIDFRFMHCNDSAYQMGRLPPHIIGKTMLEALPHLKGSDYFNMHKQVVLTGIPYQSEMAFKDEDGVYGWFIVSLKKLEDGLVSNFVDITEKKQDEKKIKEQADLLNSILNASINGVFACEAINNERGDIVDFRLLKINQAFTTILGKTAEEVIGNTYLNIFPGAKAAGLFDMHVQVLQTGVPIQQEVYYNSEGYDGWYHISINKLGSNGLVQTFNDITESKRYKQALEDASRNLQEIIDVAQASILLLTPIRQNNQIIDFRFRLVNRTFAAYMHQPPKVLFGRLVSEWFPGYQQGELFTRYVHTFETGEQQRFNSHYNENGLDLWMDILTTKFEDALLVTFLDFTPLKKLHQQLEASVDNLKQSNAQLEEFTYAASHDLQEPLRKIHFFSDKLKNGLITQLQPEEKRMLERMEAATQRMRSLIDDLLKYSHATFKSVTFAKVNISQLVQEVLADMVASIEEKEAKISIGPLPQLTGDRRQLRQLLQNLISNALKYKKPDVPPQISITATTVSATDVPFPTALSNGFQRYYLIEVADNGIGFEQEHAEKIFNVFQRLHGRNEFSGTGIGLAIVRKVIDNHNGFISAESELDKGAVFKIYLPCMDDVMD